MHCWMLVVQLGIDCIARTAEPTVTPFFYGLHIESERVNHERSTLSTLKLRRKVPQRPLFSPNFGMNSEVLRRTQQVAECSAYPACADAGLVNDCCPTSEGVVLGCCAITSSPVLAPTNRPVAAPTGPPSLPPIFITNKPTSAPVRNPTITPTVAPLPLPTTNRPTRDPTRAPITSRPTVNPTTPFPVELPTTPFPTSLPTFPPLSLAPVRLPSSAPTLPPTVGDNGSDKPSATPSTFFEFDTTSLSVLDVRLSLKRDFTASRRKLQEDNCTQILKDVLRDRIETEIDSIIQRHETLSVDIQKFTSTFSNASLATYVFDVLLEIRSPLQEYEPNRYIEGPFDSQVEKNLVAEALRATDCPEFSDVTTMDIAVPRKVEDKSPSDGDGNSLSMGVIAGIAVAGAVLVMTVIAIFIVSRKSRHAFLEDDSSPNVPQKQTQESHEYALSEIDGFNFNTDISTLGDPTPTEAKSGRDVEDSTIDSVNVDYDFKKAFLDVQSVTDSQLVEASDDSSPRHRIATLDDPSLLNGGSTSDIVTAAGDTLSSPRNGTEEQYDLVAPPGILGLIIESSPVDGRPVVYNIKPTSPLANVVKVGDRIVALDGIVVSALRASDVSRLIAEKKDHSRLLVLSRSPKSLAL